MRVTALNPAMWGQYRALVDTALVACSDTSDWFKGDFFGSDYTVSSALAERLEQELPGRVLLFPPIACYDHSVLTPQPQQPHVNDQRTYDFAVDAVEKYIHARLQEGFKYIVIVTASRDFTVRLSEFQTQAASGQRVLLWHYQPQQERGEELASMSLYLNVATRRVRVLTDDADGVNEGKRVLRVYFEQLLKHVQTWWTQEQ